jgi:isopentenyl diphosphate isomerase/L-lactate dehydrogenase-like FMN-dependent dehydrogenase
VTRSAPLTVADVQRRARRLPRAVVDLIDAGAGDEVTLRANRVAFERIALRPRLLRDVSVRSSATTVVGQPLSMPVLLAPCGFARMVHRDGELAVARGAARADTPFVLTGGSSFPTAAVVRAGGRPVWYQLYAGPGRAETAALLDEAEKAGCTALCVTLDGHVRLARDRDYRNRVTVPLARSPRVLLEGARRPRWLVDFLRGRVARGPACARIASDYWRLAIAAAHTPSVTVEDLRWLRERWRGPLVAKGVMRGDECAALIDCGVDAVIVSNHGGRLLDGTPATIEVLPEIVDAVAGRAEVLVDGGIRRGTDVAKALALGARACLVGRPYLWGLAAGGEEGVVTVLEILRRELDQTMALLGCASVGEIDASIARPARG